MVNLHRRKKHKCTRICHCNIQMHMFRCRLRSRRQFSQTSMSCMCGRIEPDTYGTYAHKLITHANPSIELSPTVRRTPCQMPPTPSAAIPSNHPRTRASARTPKGVTSAQTVARCDRTHLPCSCYPQPPPGPGRRGCSLLCNREKRKGNQVTSGHEISQNSSQRHAERVVDARGICAWDTCAHMSPCRRRRRRRRHFGNARNKPAEGITTGPVQWAH